MKYKITIETVVDDIPTGESESFHVNPGVIIANCVDEGRQGIFIVNLGATPEQMSYLTDIGKVRALKIFDREEPKPENKVLAPSHTEIVNISKTNNRN